MSFPRYPKYKESGVQWLGEVPGHWEMPPLYLRYEILLGKMLDEKRITGNHLMPYLRNVDVQWDRVNVNDLPVMDVEPDEIERFTLRSGDLLVCEGGEVGRAAIWHGQLTHCGYQKAIHRLRPRSQDEIEQFLYYCFRFAVDSGIFVAGSNPNTIPHLTAEKLRLYRFPSPPREEQSWIASFLDREAEKIDALIAEQQRLIELLKEKRRAVISHAVTKGLNPDAPMKPSGVEWLGDVPSHWEVVRMRYLCDIGTGGRDTEDAVENGCYPFFVRSQTVERINSAPYNCEAILTAGDGVGVGRVFHHYSGRFDVHQRVYVLSNFQRLSGRFLFHYLRENFYKIALEGGAKSTVDSLRRPVFTNFHVCVPPADEQTEIADRIDCDSTRFDALTADAERAITLLQERRTALISAAVTGKIDVRGLAAPETSAA